LTYSVVPTGPFVTGAAAFRFAFDLFYLPFIHSSTAPKRAKIFSTSTGWGFSCGFKSNGNTYLLPF